MVPFWKQLRKTLIMDIINNLLFKAYIHIYLFAQILMVMLQKIMINEGIKTSKKKMLDGNI